MFSSSSRFERPQDEFGPCGLPVRVENINLVASFVVGCPLVPLTQVKMILKDHGSLIWARIVFRLGTAHCWVPPGIWVAPHELLCALFTGHRGRLTVFDPIFFLCRYDHLLACIMVCRCLFDFKCFPPGRTSRYISVRDVHLLAPPSALAHYFGSISSSPRPTVD